MIDILYERSYPPLSFASPLGVWSGGGTFDASPPWQAEEGIINPLSSLQCSTWPGHIRGKLKLACLPVCVRIYIFMCFVFVLCGPVTHTVQVQVQFKYCILLHLIPLFPHHQFLHPLCCLLCKNCESDEVGDVAQSFNFFLYEDTFFHLQPSRDNNLVAPCLAH